MKSTEMTFLEVAEYTGYTMRKPTVEEMDAVLSFMTIGLLHQRQESGMKIPLSTLTEEVNKIVDAMRPELEQTAMIMDFASVGKKVMVHHQICIALQDHSDIKEFLGMLPPLDREEQREFEKEVKKASTEHNHIMFMYHYLLIDHDGTVEHLKSGRTGVCLKENQTKAEKK